MDKTNIINHALTLLGQGSVLSPEGDEQINNLFEPMKKRLLRSYPFPCAKKDYVLNPLADVPDFGFMYKYQIPADCLRIDPRFFADFGGVRKGDAVYTDAPAMKFTGISNVKENELTEDVAALLSYDLAIETCFAHSGDMQLKEQLKNEREKAFVQAKRVAAQESTPEEITYDCSWSFR